VSGNSWGSEYRVRSLSGHIGSEYCSISVWKYLGGVNTVFDHCLEVSGEMGAVHTVFNQCLEIFGGSEYRFDHCLGISGQAFQSIFMQIACLYT
jgi:hypothetical protein